MKKTVFLALAVLLLAGCAGKEAKVMARFVPERADDFVFENNLIAGRIYGEALEGNPTSPGIDIWVKLPGKLVADEWYSHAVSDGDEDYYHHDHGGKDCYKVAVSLGGGASAPLIENRLQYPATNYRSWEVLESTPEKVVFVLHYPEWEADEDVKVALDKKITVIPDTYLLKCEDTYTFTGTDSLCIAAGAFRHLALDTIAEEYNGEDRFAFWEKASDQSKEPEDGMLGVAVYMPDADWIGLSHGDDHSICVKKVASGEPLTYYFGNCWSKGDIKTAEAWFEYVKNYK